MADPEEDMEDIMGFHKAKRDLKAIYDHSNSESSDNEHCKMLYVMFGGSLGITSHCIVKNLCRGVAAAASAPMAAHTIGGWRRRSALTPLTALRAWQGLGRSRCLSP
jgi:hypothetical protein